MVASIDLEPLRELVDDAQVVDLYPTADRSGERDKRWNVMTNIEIEPDDYTLDGAAEIARRVIRAVGRHEPKTEAIRGAASGEAISA